MRNLPQGLLFLVVAAGGVSALCACSDLDEVHPEAAEGGGGQAGAAQGGAGGSGGELSDCEVLGLPERPFVEAPSSDRLYATAANITVPTTAGAYGLKAGWTGCDVMLFIQDAPRQTQGSPVPLWSRDVDTLLLRAPKNTRFFFSSTKLDQTAIDNAVAELQAKVEDALAAMLPEDAEWWRRRIHYVNAPQHLLPSWLGDVMADPGWGVGIDRFQRIRYIGSYADPTRWSASMQWFAPNLSMAANEAIYYNFEHLRETRLGVHDKTTVSVFPGGPGSDGSPTDVEFPDAATMAEFDTMQLDLTMGCNGEGELGFCPAWDRLAHVYLCPDPAEPDQCDVEVGRWITTYHREGRWVHDASALLPLFSKGGTFRVRFATQDPWEVKLDIHLSSKGKSVRAEETTYLFDSYGVPFDASYNDAFDPIELPIPADAKKVELATIISGHGQVDPGNCAEFCVTTHHFFVNGHENVLSLEGPGAMYDCMNKTNEGTVPNQYGTWWFGRSGWCPGLEVPIGMMDITDQATAGQPATFDYEGSYQGQPYSASASIRMRSWLVVSR